MKDEFEDELKKVISRSGFIVNSNKTRFQKMMLTNSNWSFCKKKDQCNKRFFTKKQEVWLISYIEMVVLQ